MENHGFPSSGFNAEKVLVGIRLLKDEMTGGLAKILWARSKAACVSGVFGEAQAATIRMKVAARMMLFLIGIRTEDRPLDSRLAYRPK